MASRKSDTKIRSETKFWSKKVKKIASKLKNKRSENKLLNKTLDEINKGLNNPAYNKAQNSYNDYKSQSDKLKVKIKKSKSKKTKTKLQNQLNEIAKKRSTYAQQMAGIARNKGFSALHSRKIRQEAKIRNSNRLISSLERQKSYAKGKCNGLRNTLLNRQRTRIQRKNSRVMSKKIRHAKQHGASVLYRTDMMDSEVFWLYETSPSETDSNSVATKPVDGSTPQTNVVSRDSKELSGTYYLKGKNLKDADNKFDKLQKWSAKYEFTIKGFSNWKHAYITSVAKSTDESSNKNSLVVAISFTYAVPAKIKYSKQSRGKGRSKTKAPAKKVKGSSTKNRAAKVKPGMTYAQIASKHHVSLSHVMKINKWPANKLPVGAKVRL